MNDLIQTVLVYALPVVFAITLYEAARGYAARYFGDTTALAQGRLSFNPMVHIDPIGTLVMPAVLYLVSNGTFLFGYAKPMPINYSMLRDPKRNLKWIALSGPAFNLVMGFAWLLLSLLLGLFKIDEIFFLEMTRAGVLTNLAMFAFHLLPIPPLAGGQILLSLLPHAQAYKFAKIEPYCFFILIGLAMLHILQYWMGPLMALGGFALQLLASPFYMLLG
ncbi:site-2 protease family protein [Undibacterium sp. TS12]|uniref:site-2 protease family protein n=1 Tax=Undibacterium sp. TS12 TaxID=2908202 RepID=UPI001F4D0720|nr:site-2 protease family protein [Undibacterium sp. TS12]MCH8620558.1 site-2 protease family protein [Undibacterium sp. TS12]